MDKIMVSSIVGRTTYGQMDELIYSDEALD